MITMRQSLGKLSNPAAIGIRHTIRKAKALLLLSSSPFNFSTISSGNDDGSSGGATVVGRGRGTVSQSEEINKLKKKKTPRKSRIDDQTGNRKQISTLHPPSTPILSSVVSSGATAAGGRGKKLSQATTPTPVGTDKGEEDVNKPEAVMICIDNSLCMKYQEPYRYKLQIKSLQSYCRVKIESNPKNLTGILTMNTFEVKNNLFPTNDLDEILRNLKYQLQLGGALDFKKGIKDAWWHLPLDEQSKKRMIFFIGGPVNLNVTKAKAIGKKLKELGVAVDVVNFWREGRYRLSKKALDAFVAAANNNNNSHIHHLQVEPSTRFKEVLLRTQLFTPEEEKIARNKKAKENRMRRNKLKMLLQPRHDKLIKETTMWN